MLFRSQLERACIEADASMKMIDATLHVTPMFFKLDAPALTQGNILTAMTEQLRKQVYERVLARAQRMIEETPSGTMTTKNKNALLRMLDKTAEINVLNDGEVTARIEAMKAQINADALIPMRDELLSVLDESAGALELIDPTAEARRTGDGSRSG